jgi:hypothetical protein
MRGAFREGTITENIDGRWIVVRLPRHAYNLLADQALSQHQEKQGAAHEKGPAG